MADADGFTGWGTEVVPPTLAPNVVRVGTDTDGTPIGTCWGRDLPQRGQEGQWWWRSHEHDRWEYRHDRHDLLPDGDWWVQCRPPATPTRPAGQRWTVHEYPNDDMGAAPNLLRDGVVVASIYKPQDPQAIADALNAAESSATRPEPVGIAYWPVDGEPVVRMFSGEGSEAPCVPPRATDAEPLSGGTPLRAASSPVLDGEPADDDLDNWHVPPISTRHYRMTPVDPDVPPVPRPGPGEHLTTAGWYRQHNGWWTRVSLESGPHWGTWRLPDDMPDDTPMLVRRADNQETEQ